MNPAPGTNSKATPWIWTDNFIACRVLSVAQSPFCVPAPRMEKAF